MLRSVLISVLLVLAAVAEVAAGGAGFGPHLGYQRAKDAEEGKFMFGVAARLKPLPALAFEGSISYRQEEYADGDLTVRSWPVQATGLIYPLPLVYGAVGVGWYNLTFDYGSDLEDLADDETEQEFGWHFGAGIELPLAGTAVLTGDIRYVFIDYDFEEFPGSEDIDSDFYMITVGLLFGL